jgi:hypothetical protein
MKGTGFNPYINQVISAEGYGLQPVHMKGTGFNPYMP